MGSIIDRMFLVDIECHLDNLKAWFSLANTFAFVKHIIFISRLRSNANAFVFAFDEQVNLLRTLFQRSVYFVYICILTVNNTFFLRKRHIHELLRLSPDYNKLLLSWATKIHILGLVLWTKNFVGGLGLNTMKHSDFLYELLELRTRRTIITSHGEDGCRPQWPLYPRNNYLYTTLLLTSI